jgi:large subunit ribosomal protein L7/L12
VANYDDKIKALEERLRQARKQKQLAEARLKAKTDKQKRAIETRQKILLGAFILDQINKRGEFVRDVQGFEYDGVRFADWLTRENDRAVFGMTTTNKIGG